MIQMISDEPGKENNSRIIKLKYDHIRDEKTMEEINKILLDQPRCLNCGHFYREGNFCGYNACVCDLGHNIEAGNSKYHNIDGRDCEDYIKNEEEKWPIHNKNEALQMIVDLSDDYDNANSVEGLKNLIDELVEVAKAGMAERQTPET